MSLCIRYIPMSEEQKSTDETTADAESTIEEQPLNPDNSSNPEIPSATESADGAQVPPEPIIPEEAIVDPPIAHEPDFISDEAFVDPTDGGEQLSPIDIGEVDTPLEDSVTEPADGADDLQSAESEGSKQSRPGYTGEILGEVVPLASLNEQQEISEEKKERTEHLTTLIENSMNKVSSDEIVAGRVISVGEKDVIIDIGFKSDGVVSKNEFSEEVELGDEVDVYLEKMENYHGQLVLSRERAEEIRHWQQVEHAYENGTILEGTIIRRIKGGMIVDLFKGLEAFLPGSQIDMRPVRDFDSYLDRKMEFKIVKINIENQNVVVSHKALIERELASQRESILSTMETGQVLEGIAKNITDFGVFVDLGGVDGLLHITDLSWGRVSHPTEVISLDQELKVVVLEYDKERQRISLGLKQLQPHPWDNIEERYKPGDIVEGKVVSIMDYGAFLELEQGIEGLVHVSEMSWTGNVRHPSQRVALGQIVKVSVLNIDHDLQKISLGMKQFEVNPWEGIATRYPPGTILRGSVRNITHFGVFVEIETGIDGLVHVSDLSWTKTIRHPSELIKKRQELSVIVLDVDEKRQRIALGHKQIETNPWTNLATVFATGTDHKGKVVRIERKGLRVELPYEVEAFVPEKELKNQHESGFQPYQEGDELELRVIRLDVERKEIVMSETAKKRQEEAKIRRKEKDSERAERREEEKAVRQHTRREKISSGPTTIGELSGLESLKEKIGEEKPESSEEKNEAAPRKDESTLEDGEVGTTEEESGQETTASVSESVESDVSAEEATSDDEEESEAIENQSVPEDTEADLAEAEISVAENIPAPVAISEDAIPEPSNRLEDVTPLEPAPEDLETDLAEDPPAQAESDSSSEEKSPTKAEVQEE